MTKTASKTGQKTPIAEGITHVIVNMDSFWGVPADEMRKAILLQAQGEPAEIKDDYSILVLLTILDALHSVSPELVLKTEHGRFLIFDHQSVPVLRDKDIVEHFAKEAVHKESEQTYVPSLEIDIETVWRENERPDYLEYAFQALKKIRTLLRPSEIVTLIGKEPPLLFLLVYHLLYGLAGEVWYQKTRDSQAIRIR